MAVWGIMHAVNLPTDLYLKCGYYHHLILSTLVQRARALCDHDSICDKLEILKDTCRQHGSSDWQIHRSINPAVRAALPKDRLDSVILLPYVRSNFNHISRVLSQHSIELVGLPLRKSSGFLWLFKDDQGLRIPRLYSIPCECGQACNGQTGHSVGTRWKHHHQYIWLEHSYKSAGAEYSLNLGHRIQLHKTSILSYQTQIFEIELDSSNVSREVGFWLSKPWKSLICSLKECRKHPLQDSLDGFSTGSCRPGHTDLIMAQTLTSLGTHQTWNFFPLMGIFLTSHSSCLLLASSCFILISCLAYSLKLKMEAVMFLQNSGWPSLDYVILYPRR
jgi:hypothetical protein